MQWRGLLVSATTAPHLPPATHRQGVRALVCFAVAVHPLFQHTLATPPAPEPRTLEEVPEDVLHLIAQRLPTAQQLCVLACVNRRCK